MSSGGVTCSSLARAAAVPLAGSASTALGYVCIEHNGPWGPKILKDVTFGEPGTPAAELGARLSEGLPIGVTPLLIHRYGTKHGIPSPAVVMVVALTPHGGRGITRTAESLDEIAAMDFRALISHARLGSTPAGWEELGTTYLVCTHAKRDQCCAVFGRPIVDLLSELRPEATWEVSHLGGHRMAPNVMTFPDGVHYGRIDTSKVTELIKFHENGGVYTRRMRGRAALAPAVQAAEIKLRIRLRIHAADGLRLISASAGALDDTDTPPDHGPLTTSTWEIPETGERWQVTVVTTTPVGAPLSISCGADPVSPPPEQRVRAVTRL